MQKSFRSVLKHHGQMVFDLQRTIPLIQSIQKNVKRGDIVVDVGCGIGLLTFAACKAGAKRVYGIDVDSEALEFAKWQAKKLGVEKKICWLEDHSYNVDLIEKADVLIQETIGFLAFDENFLPTLIDAKKRFLKKGGKIIPEEVRLVGAPVSPKKTFLTKPATLASIKTKTTTKNALKIQKSWLLTKGVGPFDQAQGKHLLGILVWPKIVWAKGLITDCAPSKKPTHWGQTLLPCGTPPEARLARLDGRERGWAKGGRYRTVRKLKFSLKINPHPKNPLYNTKIEWQIGAPHESKRFKTRSCYHF